MFSAGLTVIVVFIICLFAPGDSVLAQSWGLFFVSTNGATPLSSVAMSADGTNMVICSDSGVSGISGQIFTSTNSGVNWQVTSAPANWWTCVASSADGTKLVAGAYHSDPNPGGIYTSSDSGSNWTLHLGNQASWAGVASSADGSKLVAVIFRYADADGLSPFGIYHSVDSGATWQPATGDGTTNSWAAVASSADGTRLVAATSGYGVGNSIYVSSDSGATWTLAYAASLASIWYSVASSADGRKLVAVGAGGIYTSSNYGATWQNQPGAPSSTPWNAVASSADGVQLAAGGMRSKDKIYRSFDSGVTWIATNKPPTGGTASIASSTNGAKLAEISALLGDAVYILSPNLSVTGHVFCACNSNGISGASILIGTNQLTADTNGAYALTNIPAGTYIESATATDFLPLTNLLVLGGNRPWVTNDFYLTNSTFVIYPMFDSSITSNPDAEAITNAIWAATQVYTNYIVDPICVRILFSAISNGLASSQVHRVSISYSQYVADLQAVTNKSANDNIALASLHPPPLTGLLSNTVVWLGPAILNVLGEHQLADISRMTNGGPDGIVGLNVTNMNFTRLGQDTNKYDLQASAMHETDEVLGIGGMGSVLYLQGSYSGEDPPTFGVGPLDLYRYVSNGFRSFNYSAPSSPYFSIDGGATRLVYFNQYANGSDYADWGNGTYPAVGAGNTPSQVQDAFGTPGTAPNLGASELIALDVIGYTLSANTVIQNVSYNAGAFVFTAAAVPGQTYQVQYSTSMTGGSWQNLGNPMVATGLIVTVTDTTANGEARYYRLVTIPPLNGTPHLANPTPRTAVQTGPFTPVRVGNSYFLPHLGGQ